MSSISVSIHSSNTYMPLEFDQVTWRLENSRLRACSIAGKLLPVVKVGHSYRHKTIMRLAVPESVQSVKLSNAFCGCNFLYVHCTVLTYFSTVALKATWKSIMTSTESFCKVMTPMKTFCGFSQHPL